MTPKSAPMDAKTNLRNFSDLPISLELKKGIKELGYITPTPFQLEVFENFKSGKNVMGVGSSSYGKSLAFSLPILSKIVPDEHNLQAMVVCETAAQAELLLKEERSLGRYLNIAIGSALERAPGAESLQLSVSTADDMIKADPTTFRTVHTVYLDGTNEYLTKSVLEKITAASSHHPQLLVCGNSAIDAIKAHAPHLLEDAAIVENSDQPKMVTPAKHIYHLGKEAEPKPRTLLAALEVHRPKFALITCSEKEEALLLSRYLSRYGYRIKICSEDFDQKEKLSDLLLQGHSGALDAVIFQSSMLAQENLENIEVMINYDMFDRSQNYEAVTQFKKQASGITRTIINILTSRETGYLGPIKAQCLIDFVEMPLPSFDEVMSLCAQRIVDTIKVRAQDIELSQFEVLAQKIFSDEKNLLVLSYLLRNHLNEQSTLKKAEALGEKGWDARRKREVPKRHNDNRERPYPKVRETQKPSAERDLTDEQKSSGKATLDGVCRLYVTLGKRDGFLDLASLAQYLSETSSVDLGHFSGMGMVRDTSAHIEVDGDVADTIIEAVNKSPRPQSTITGAEGEPLDPVVCERAKASIARPFRRPAPRRRPNFERRS